ncbi:alpha/beta hydrolase [Amycolatopsis sp. NBC_00348]|uniref:alpha/beta hydrolase n=1 Tax=Amycolatopsis sp. NBC_00348 TaxID=2975956 RepID=UPI002E26D3E4
MKLVLAAVAMLVAGLLPPASVAVAVAPATPRVLFDHPCEDHPDYECGTISVPMDYDRPSGARLTVKVSKLKATGPAAQRQGVLVYNPGGPGSSGLYRAAILPDSVRRVYDYIGFDPRGVGGSSPISCVDGPAFFAQPVSDPDPGGPADKARAAARARQYATGCARRSGAELPHLTTTDTARDIDEIRKALGEQRISYYGSSYGTYLGLVYGQLFPGRVRRMVLDSVADADPADVWYRGNLDQDVALQARAEQWFDWIARHDDVFHLGVTRQAVEVAGGKARARLAHAAIGVLGPGELDAVILNSAYFDTNWVSNARALSDYATRSDPAALVELARLAEPTSAAAENATAAYTAISCNEGVWPRDWTRWDRDSTAYAAKAPLETWANTWSGLPCAYWPVPNRQPMAIDGRGLPPVLMLQATMDGATPFEGAVRTHDMVPSSRMIIESGGGSHGLYNRPQVRNACVDGYATDYLLTAAMPAADVVCPAHPEPTP